MDDLELCQGVEITTTRELNVVRVRLQRNDAPGGAHNRRKHHRDEAAARPQVEDGGIRDEPPIAKHLNLTELRPVAVVTLCVTRADHNLQTGSRVEVLDLALGVPLARLSELPNAYSPEQRHRQRSLGDSPGQGRDGHHREPVTEVWTANLVGSDWGDWPDF